MTDSNQSGEQEARSQSDVLENLTIAELRKAAGVLSIPSQRDWTKEDFVKAIKEKQENNATTLVFDNSQAPKPGHARILIHRDPTPGSKNSPVPIGLNGHMFQVPRGVEVDVPKPFIDVLANARTIEVRQQSGESRNNPAGTYKDDEQISYPFQVLMITPGDYRNPYDSRGVSYAIRKEFAETHGAWPTEGELKEFRMKRIANSKK